MNQVKKSRDGSGLAVIVYLIFLTMFAVFPLYMHWLNPYEFGPALAWERPAGLLWGHTGYAKTALVFAIFSVFYWAFAAFMMAIAKQDSE